METKTKGLLPWPTDAKAFVAEAKKTGKVQHWNTDLQKFVKETVKGKGENVEVVYSDPDPSDPIFFGLPHVNPNGVQVIEQMTDVKGGPAGKRVTYKPLEDIEGIPVLFLMADLETGCGVYLRADVYEVNRG